MLIRTSIDGPLFYEFIFNLSFVPRLVCLSGFMLSPLGSEVMISCHVAFFRVIFYNPVLQIKMTTTMPPGHVHEDFSIVIAEVKPAPAGRQHKTSTPLYRQEPPRLLASVALFTLSRPLQISTRQRWPDSLSLTLWRSLSDSLLSSVKARGFFLPLSWWSKREKLNWWNTTNALLCISKGGNLWFIASTLLFFLSRAQKDYRRERRETKRRTDGPSKRDCCFLSFYISDASKPSKTQIHWKSRETV